MDNRRWIVVGAFVGVGTLSGCLPRQFNQTGEVQSAITPEVRAIIDARKTPEIKRTLMGALLFLDDTQIRNRQGKLSSFVDYCGGDGCAQRVLQNIAGRYMEIPAPPAPPAITGLSQIRLNIRNDLGEWASTVHFLPARLGDSEGESLVAVQDSNVFTTAAIVFPLYLFTDTQVQPHERVISEMVRTAVSTFPRYKRGDAYNFWLMQDGITSDVPVTGPYNIPVKMTELMGRTLGTSDWGFKFWKLVTRGLDVPDRAWIDSLLDKEQNPYGYDAAFNVPNDADDTSAVVATQKIHAQITGDTSVSPDMGALKVVTNYRDVPKRTKDDPRTKWKGETPTGAYLTWLKDENVDTFGTPKTGVIPLGVNNVDCVVNANTLFALGVTGATDWAGFQQAAEVMLTVAKTKAWKEKCGLYYPQRMMFPYVMSRAYRDGGVRTPTTELAAEFIMRELLNEQEASGAFSGGVDKTEHVSTALAAVTLMNIGSEKAERMGRGADFDAALEKAVAFLIRERKDYSLRNMDTFNRKGQQVSGKRLGYRWDSGLFFSASFWDFAQWRSEAYTVAIVTEALAKYVLAYDRGGVSILQGRRLHVVGTSPSVTSGELTIEVK